MQCCCRYGVACGHELPLRLMLHGFGSQLAVCRTWSVMLTTRSLAVKVTGNRPPSNVQTSQCMTFRAFMLSLQGAILQGRLARWNYSSASADCLALVCVGHVFCEAGLAEIRKIVRNAPGLVNATRRSGNELVFIPVVRVRAHTMQTSKRPCVRKASGREMSTIRRCLHRHKHTALSLGLELRLRVAKIKRK